MKKRIITLALAAVLTFAFSINAAAAPSPEAKVVDSTGATIGVSALNDNVWASTELTVTKASVEDLTASVATAVSANGATIAKSFAFELNGEVPADGKVTVSVEGMGVNPGDIIYCYHWVNGGVQGETATAVGKDLVTISGLKSFSPFLLVKVIPNQTAAAAPATTATGSKSPKTGLSVDAYLAALADLF